MNEVQSTIQGLAGQEIKVYDANYDNSKIDKDGFLKILLASFKVQDPFETQDISKFIENTVKLRQLEVMNNFEDSVKKMSSNDALFLSATNMIGKKVLYEGEETYVQNGKSSVAFTLKEDVPQATLYIYDKNNNIVAKQEYKDLKAGKQYDFTLDDAQLADGYYRVSVVAKNGEKEVPHTIYATALVTGIQKDDNALMATYANGAIDITKITKIGV